MYRKIFFIFCSLLLSVTALALPVDRQTASKTASALLHKQVVDATPAFFTECYLFVGADGKGFALVAADDCVSPILGYSLNGSFPAENLPHHIRTWIDAYQYDISVAKTLKQSGNQSKYRTIRDTVVGPLLTTTWNQAPWYNEQCPFSIADSAYSVTGCVATAMAQVMKYWNHPVHGRGSHSYVPSGFSRQSVNFDTTYYDWANMPNALGPLSSHEEIAAVAQLMHHAGVAVDMNYSPSSSGAVVSSYGNAESICAENALKNFFRYNQALFSAFRDEYTNAEWNDLLTTELNASRPILFSGRDNDGGHAFVIDGYDTLGYYHVNWGWGGYCDGYYTFDTLSPTGSGIGGNASNSYSYNNSILLHVFPASENSSVRVSVVSSDTLLGVVSGGGNFAPYTATTLHATATEGHRFFSWASGNHYNPFTFSPNNNHTDTAIFVPVYGDTLGYCFTGYQGLWGEYNNNPPEWGIRIPANSVPSRRKLDAVQFYGVSDADYSVKVLLGNNQEQLIFATTKHTNEFEWYTVPLNESVPLIDSLPVWVVLTSRSYTNPAVYSSYSGNPDGSWYKRAGTTWEHLEDRNEYHSWMIQALLSELEKVTVSVEANVAGRGTVSGGGDYYPGDTALLTAEPAPGFRFAGWSTGERDNPLRYRVTAAASLVANFVSDVAIDEVEGNTLSYTLNGLALSVSNPTALPVELYDIEGRQLSTSHLSPFTFHLPAAGVYLLRCGAFVKKIVTINP